MVESGQPARPTIIVQDAGTGQHPDDFGATLLSLLASNKKTKTHQMGVYNAGGAASYRFARFTIVVSRLAPQLLGLLRHVQPELPPGPLPEPVLDAVKPGQLARRLVALP